MSINLSRPLMSTSKASLWLSVVSLFIAAVTLAMTLSFQKAQKEVDALSEFRQLYLAQGRLLNLVECIHKKVPELPINLQALANIRSAQESMRKTMAENRGKDIGFEVQKAVIIGGLEMVTEGELQISRIVADATEPQLKAIKSYCRVGENG